MAARDELSLHDRPLGPGTVPVSLSINGKVHEVLADPATTLAEVLRDELGLTGTKIGCDRGACSACTVWVDGEVVASCMTLAFDVRGRQITTIEGLARRRQASSRAAGIRRSRCDAVRFLHTRHGDELCGAGRA